MRHVPLISLALAGAALACGPSTPDAKPKLSFVQALVAERVAADTRTDAFTLAADRGRVLGDSTAALWVVIVSDFQCAACKRWHDEVYPLVRKEYVETGKVRLAFINMPLEAHLNAEIAAIGAGCASAEGRFWETADRIFATQSRWKGLPDARPFVDSIAILAGVDAGTQRLCSERARAMKLVRMDRDRSRAEGVHSLPALMIGTHKLMGFAPFETVRAVIDSALNGR